MSVGRGMAFFGSSRVWIWFDNLVYNPLYPSMLTSVFSVNCHQRSHLVSYPLLYDTFTSHHKVQCRACQVALLYDALLFFLLRIAFDGSFS